jgi:hypothetical protein
MKKLELFGLTIITLIVTAFITTPAFFAVSPLLKTEMGIMLLAIVTMAGITVRQLLYPNSKPVSTKVVLYCCLVLFASSSIVFFFSKEYFLIGSTFPLSFWHRVSFYTLPAITLESALVSLFKIFLEKSTIAGREHRYIKKLFYTYTLSTMAVNFMVILRLLEVQDHLYIARFVIVTAILVTILTTRKILLSKI